MGNHIEWTPRGLGLALPPRDSTFAVYDITEDIMEPSYEDGDPFHGYTLSGEFTWKDGKKHRNYPALAYTRDSPRSSTGPGIFHSSTIAVGLSGPLGWLGVPTLMARGGLLNGNNIASTSSLINVFATVHVGVLEEENGPVPPVDPTNTHDSIHNSSWLDERVLFWGLFSDENEMQGVISPAIRGTKAAEVHLTDASMPAIDEIVPGYGFPSQSTDTNISEPSLGSLEFSYVLPEGMVHLKEGIHNWRMVAENSAWSAQSGSFSIGLIAPNGFAQWPDVSKRILHKIAEDLPSESVLVFAGGCNLNAQKFTQLPYCVYVICCDCYPKS